MEGMNKVVDDAARCTEINDLPEDVLVEIVSRINRRDAVRTSILSRKWRFLPSLVCSSSLPVTLVLDHRDLSTKSFDPRAQFLRWVDRVLELHRDVSLDGLTIRAPYLSSPRYVPPPARDQDRKPGDAQRWVSLAVRKRVKVFELANDNLLLEDGVGDFAFVSLTFVGGNIGDKVLHDFLKRSPHLEKLCIRRCSFINDLKVIDLPRLRFLEISECKNAERLEISVPSLVSCTLGSYLARSFVYEPEKHVSYSEQLVELKLNFLKMFQSSFLRFPDLPRLSSLKHLELDFVLPVGKSTHFFTNFIDGSPLLKELRIKISYIVKDPRSNEKLGFPEESPRPKLSRNHHKNLEVVKMSGYVGCTIDDRFILRLLNIAHESLKTIAIDTESEYYDQKPWDCATQCNGKGGKGRPCSFCSAVDVGERTRVGAKRRANQLLFGFPPLAKAVLFVT